MSSLQADVPRLAERTPLDWHKLLGERLAARREQLQVYEAYYGGDHPMQFATTKFQEAFGNLFAAFADNWCEIVVDAAVERLRIQGFRFGEQVSNEAWDLWQQNGLDLQSKIAHTEAGKCGECFLLVDPAPESDFPLITVEHPLQVIVARDPANPRRRLAALKEWEGDDGYLYATIYLPDMVLRFESEAPMSSGQQVSWIDRRDEPAVVANPYGVVPMIPLENKPGLLVRGSSDLSSAIPLQNAVNKLCTDMIVASEYGAFRQRVMTGVTVPRDPETGKPINKPQIEAAMSRIWSTDSKDARVYDMAATDLQNFVKAIDMLIQHLAAQTRTPPHYLLGQITNASGDALKTAEAGLVQKCRGKIEAFSDSWEEAIALALAGGPDGSVADCETVWADPENTSLSVLVDATLKKQALGVPRDILWLELGYTPEQIEMMKPLADAEQQAKLDQQQQQFERQQALAQANKPQPQAQDAGPRQP